MPKCQLCRTAGWQQALFYKTNIKGFQPYRLTSLSEPILLEQTRRTVGFVLMGTKKFTNSTYTVAHWCCNDINNYDWLYLFCFRLLLASHNSNSCSNQKQKKKGSTSSHTISMMVCFTVRDPELNIKQFMTLIWPKNKTTQSENIVLVCDFCVCVFLIATLFFAASLLEAPLQST